MAVGKIYIKRAQIFSLAICELLLHLALLSDQSVAHITLIQCAILPYLLIIQVTEVFFSQPIKESMLFKA